MAGHRLKPRLEKLHRAGIFLAGLLIWVTAGCGNRELKENMDLFEKDNLVAWCIVPFDARERSPVERAAMLKGLGISKVAYDWRQKHVEEFEEEILAYKEFHHGHDHIDNFEKAIELMLPDLICLNLNGMNSQPEPKILALGTGEHDESLLRIIAESGYEGPIGIIGHQAEMDVEIVLNRNLKGLESLRNPRGHQ